MTLRDLGGPQKYMKSFEGGPTKILGVLLQIPEVFCDNSCGIPQDCRFSKKSEWAPHDSRDVFLTYP
eukprot:7320176-Pyramimonas_sp.AAC.1